MTNGDRTILDHRMEIAPEQRRQLEVIAEHLATIVEHSLHFRDRHVHLEIIINPAAGGLLHERSRLEAVALLDEFCAGLVGPRAPRPGFSWAARITDGADHLTTTAGEILEAAERRRSAAPGDREVPVTVILSVGGDGTHGRIMAAAAARHAVVPPRTWFVRLPFGTGNDGPEAKDITSACNLLLTDGRPKTAGYLAVDVPGRERSHCFNIVSFGLDAYVADLTNRLKRRVRGDIYKPLADLATLAYEPRFGLKPSRLRFGTPAGQVDQVAEPLLVTAVGVSGNRSYGSGKPVLPGEENLCMIGALSLPRKLAMKKALYAGTHPGRPGVRMVSVTRVSLWYPDRLCMQIDGETTWLEPHEFPVHIELHPHMVGELGL